jgi:hypothetical protein
MPRLPPVYPERTRLISFGIEEQTTFAAVTTESELLGMIACPPPAAPSGNSWNAISDTPCSSRNTDTARCPSVVTYASWKTFLNTVLPLAVEL